MPVPSHTPGTRTIAESRSSLNSTILPSIPPRDRTLSPILIFIPALEALGGHSARHNMARTNAGIAVCHWTGLGGLLQHETSSCKGIDQRIGQPVALETFNASAALT
jgi:hypothetical protein